MKLIYTHKKRSISSFLIRIFTFSKFSHCAVDLGAGFVIDTVLKTGVRLTSVKDFDAMYPDQTVLEIDLPDKNLAHYFAMQQVGKPYDWSAIVSLATQRDWQESDKWFCSELLEAILAAGGLKRFRDEVYKITPQQSWSRA
jgi:uncharacterized protein YycO